MAEGDIYLGIDPSPNGFNAVALQDDKVLGVWRLNHQRALGAELAHALRTCTVDIVDRFEVFGEPDIIVALESIKHITPGMSWPQLCPTMRVEGGIYQHLATSGLRVQLMTRGEIKLELLNTNRAKDGDIRAFLLQDIGETGTKKKPGPCYGLKADDWAALAAARALQNQDKRAALVEAKSA